MGLCFVHFQQSFWWLIKHSALKLMLSFIVLPQKSIIIRQGTHYYTQCWHLVDQSWHCHVNLSTKKVLVQEGTKEGTKASQDLKPQPPAHKADSLPLSWLDYLSCSGYYIWKEGKVGLLWCPGSSWSLLGGTSKQVSVIMNLLIGES